jgi:hypothetical protein
LAKKPSFATVCFANSMGRSCWQSRHTLLGGSPALPIAWAKAVGSSS